MRDYLLILLVCILSLSTFAQERTVSGKVTGESDGLPMPGVTVLLKGTSIGTISDVDGSYKLSVPSEGGAIVFSFVGLVSQEIEIGSRSVIDIALAEEVTQLQEVVVSALGVEKQTKALGYAMQSVDGESFTKARETNIVNALSGKIAGVQVTSSSGGVGASSRIVLRGVNSITGDNQPLFVVDGIPLDNTATGNSSARGGVDYGNKVADINPDDIESLSVLKGANAAALYGSRASNGVILITTKSGKGTDGIGVAVNSSTTFERPLRLPDFQNSYGQGSSDKSFVWIDGSAGDGGVDESWGPPLDKGLEFPQFTSNGDFAEPWISHPSNIENFFKTGVTLSNNVSLMGGNDKGNFRLSFTNVDQKGMLPNTDLSRTTFALNSGYNLSEKLRADFSVNYVKGKSDNIPYNGYDGKNPIQQFIWSGRQVDFEALEDYGNLPISTAGLGAGIAPVNWNTRFQNNPYWSSDNVLNGVDKDRLFGNIRVSYQINDWLGLFVRTGTDFWTEKQTRIRAQGVEATTEGNGYYSVFDKTRKETNTDFLATVNKKFTDDFGLTLNLGGNQRKETYRSLLSVAPQLQLPNVYDLSNLRSGVNYSTSDFKREKRVNSLYMSTQFSFRDYLFLELTGRNDWSSTLPSNNNSYFYPSASLSAVVSDIFDIQSNVLSFLKIRGGWAQVGNDTEPYKLEQVFAFRSPFGSVLEPAEGNTLLNPTLKPESTTSIELGIDARFFNGRINLDLTYYDQKTIDQIIPIQISSASGYTNRFANLGEVANKGIEVQLSGTPFKIGSFSWDVGINFARNENEVVELAPGLESLNIQDPVTDESGHWNVTIQARPGHPYGDIFGPAFSRDPSGNIIHENGLPVVDGTYQVIGNVTPDWTGGISNTFSFKGLELYFLIDGKYGGDIHSMTVSWGEYSGVLKETLKGREGGLVGEGVKNVGTTDNPEYVTNDVVVPAKSYFQKAYQNGVAESSVLDGTYFKLRQVQLGYTFPNKLFGNLPFSEVTLSVVGRNLAILYTKTPHIDPETASTSSNLQGIEFGQLPPSRSIGFNLSFKL